MNAATFFWIILPLIMLVGLVGKLIKKESFKSKKESLFHSMYIFGGFLPCSYYYSRIATVGAFFKSLAMKGLGFYYTYIPDYEWM